MELLNTPLKVNIPEKLHQDFKIKCVKEKSTMREMIVELLSDYLGKRSAKVN